MEYHPTVLIVLGVVNRPVYLYLGKLFFGSWDGFGEVIGYLFTPDAWSLLSGDGVNDSWATFKFFLFVCACAACVFGEYQLYLEVFA